MKLQFLTPRLVLIVAGVALGLGARFLLGPPPSDDSPPRNISRPLAPADPDELDLPLINKDGTPVHTGETPAAPQSDQSGLVPAVQLPGQLRWSNQASPTIATFDWSSEFTHDPNAVFESHGEKLCASGCAVSRHPTRELSAEEYWQLLESYQRGSLDRSNQALESLLFFGAQTRHLINQHGLASLDRSHAEFLWEQLQTTRATISLRVVDRQGRVRSWLDQSTVPFDRRHIFEMATSDLQPLVTSGTVKRVGLDHLWVRL